MACLPRGRLESPSSGRVSSVRSLATGGSLDDFSPSFLHPEVNLPSRSLPWPTFKKPLSPSSVNSKWRRRPVPIRSPTRSPVGPARTSSQFLLTAWCGCCGKLLPRPGEVGTMTPVPKQATRPMGQDNAGQALRQVPLERHNGACPVRSAADTVGRLILATIIYVNIHTISNYGAQLCVWFGVEWLGVGGYKPFFTQTFVQNGCIPISHGCSVEVGARTSAARPRSGAQSAAVLDRPRRSCCSPSETGWQRAPRISCPGYGSACFENGGDCRSQLPGLPEIGQGSGWRTSPRVPARQVVGRSLWEDGIREKVLPQCRFG